MANPKGVLLIGPRSLDDAAARYVREQVRWFVELNKRKCSFILLPDLPGTSVEVCNTLPDWLEVVLVTPGRWTRGLRWEGKKYDNVLELPMRKGYHYAQGLGEGDSYFAGHSYRFGIDWVVPGGALLAVRDEKIPCSDVEGALLYARKQYTREDVQIFTKSMRW